MKTFLDTQEAMDWCQKWVKKVDSSVSHPIIQEAIDHFTKKRKPPEYGHVCLRIWRKHRENTQTLKGK
tara:strand:+ start:30 stop:233 length:204 start_codon:yes stop_codon:yes gene_type:complete